MLNAIKYRKMIIKTAVCRCQEGQLQVQANTVMGLMVRNWIQVWMGIIMIIGLGFITRRWEVFIY